MENLLSKIDVARLLTQLVEFVPSLLAALVILIVFWIVFKLTAPTVKAVLERAGLDARLVRILVDNIYRLAILVVGLVMAADQVGINVAAALAGIGVAGLAIGFAAQDTLSNIIAGFLIFIDKPFQVGDWVRVADNYGQVSEVTMRTTRIRTKRNTYVVIPNKTIIDSVLVNHSKHGAIRVDVPVGIAYKESIPEARRVMLDAVRKLEKVLADPAPDLVVTELGASSVNMDLRVWIEDGGDERPAYHQVMEVSKLALDEAGIEIPYHHLQLFIEDVKEKIWSSAGRLAAAG